MTHRINASLAALLILTTFQPLAARAENGRYQELNRRLNETFRIHPNPRGSDRTSNINEGLQAMRSLGLTVFNGYMEAVTQTAPATMREFVFQEWLRNFQDGMPWLPLSWGYGNYPLYRYDTYMPRFEAALNSARRPFSDESLLLAYLFSSSVPHANTHNWASVVRHQAINILSRDSRFHDLRLEVHEAPSALTIVKLKKYLENVTDSTTASMIRELIKQLDSLFGTGELNQFMSVYSLTSNQRAPLDEYVNTVAKLNAVKGSSDVLKLLADKTLVDTLERLSLQAQSLSQTIKTGQGVSCQFDTTVNCTFEYIDLLRQTNNCVYSLANQLIGKAKEHHVELSFGDFLAISKTLVRSASALGFRGSDLLTQIERRSNRSDSQNLTRTQMLEATVEIETGLQNLVADFRGQFLAYITNYRAFTETVELFVDDNLRSTAILPLGNMVSAVKRSLVMKGGMAFHFNGQPSSSAVFQVMNPGIAHGPLIIPTQAQLVDPSYRWNPTGVYFLEKTPNSLQKVAGIMTASAGSMISHVQLLASNHGLPNVYISSSIIARVRPLAGQDVLLIALPNGEAQIKLWKDVNPEEQKVYNEYYKVKEKKRIRIEIPSDLDQFTYPIPLNRLRMSDAGHVAGGKATGQAEVSSIASLGKMVPTGVVLPFGVYYQHMKRTGIYDRIQQVFSAPELQGDSDEAFEARRKELAEIRKAIQNIELLPEFTSALLEILLSRPYRDDFKTYGVFVRSDTNAEDLPGFVGAGLNKTVGNITDMEEIFQAIKLVWASPFDERAFAWRNDLIENPWDILPSVVIQIGMPADKAGVMIVGSPTVNEDVENTVYLAANEGLGFTTVGGEFSAEEIVVSRNNQYSYQRLKKSYAPTRYVFRNGGPSLSADPEKKFLDSVPVVGMDPILSMREAELLARAGDTIQKHIAAKYGVLGKWDIEWCFVEGRPIIVQLRAFNGNKIARDVSSLGKLQRGRENTTEFSARFSERFLVLEDGE